jgi:hypothetical protein
MSVRRWAVAWLRWLVSGRPVRTMNPRALRWARARREGTRVYYDREYR